MFDAGDEEIVQIDFTFNAGEINSLIPLIAPATNTMLEEGANNMSAQQLSEKLDFYGIIYSLFCSYDKAGLSLFCLNRYLENAIELAADMLLTPSFDKKELATVIGKQRNEYLISREVVSVLARESFFSTVFGPGHPYGKRRELKDFDNITSEQLKSFHSDFYVPDSLYIAVAGKINKNTESLINRHFGATKRKEDVFPGPEYGRESTVKRSHTEKNSAVQTAIRIGSATIDKRHPDYPGLKVVNTILGGYFGSRLMNNLREEKGYTYGIGSILYSTQLTGIKVISTEVNQTNTREAIDEILKEITILGKEPVKKEELEIVRNYMLGNILRSLDGPFALIDNFKSLHEFGLDNDYNYILEKKIKSIGADEIMELVNTYYNIDDLTIITAGKL